MCAFVLNLLQIKYVLCVTCKKECLCVLLGFIWKPMFAFKVSSWLLYDLDVNKSTSFVFFLFVFCFVRFFQCE